MKKVGYSVVRNRGNISSFEYPEKWPSLCNSHIIGKLDAAEYLFNAASYNEKLLNDVPQLCKPGVRECSFLIDVSKLARRE